MYVFSGKKKIADEAVRVVAVPFHRNWAVSQKESSGICVPEPCQVRPNELFQKVECTNILRVPPVSQCVCMRVHIHIYTYIYIHIPIHVCTHMHICVHMNIYVHIRACTYKSCHVRPNEDFLQNECINIVRSRPVSRFGCSNQKYEKID